MSGTWERVRNSFGSTNPDSIDQFSESSFEENAILDSPETPDSIHPPGLELIENMKIIKDALNSDKAEKNLAYQDWRRFSNANDRCQASEEENKRLTNVISSLILELRKARVENADLNRMRLSKSHDCELWKTQAESWRTEAKNIEEILTNRIMKKDQKIRSLEFQLRGRYSRKDQGSQTEFEMVSSPDLSVPETEESEDSNFDYSEEVLEPVLKNEDSEISEMNVQRMEVSSEFEIPPGFLAMEECPELETSEKLVDVFVPAIAKVETNWKTIGKSTFFKPLELFEFFQRTGKLLKPRRVSKNQKKLRAPKKKLAKTPIVEALPLIEESESESEDSLEVFEIFKIPKTAKNAKKAAKKLARLEKVKVEEAEIPEVQEALPGKSYWRNFIIFVVIIICGGFSVLVSKIVL